MLDIYIIKCYYLGRQPATKTTRTGANHASFEVHRRSARSHLDGVRFGKAGSQERPNQDRSQRLWRVRGCVSVRRRQCSGVSRTRTAEHLRGASRPCQRNIVAPRDWWRRQYDRFSVHHLEYHRLCSSEAKVLPRRQRRHHSAVLVR